MTLLDDVRKAREEVKAVRVAVQEQATSVAKHEEQINGRRGLLTAIDELSEEIQRLRTSIWTVGGGIIVASVGFGISVLLLIGP